MPFLSQIHCPIRPIASASFLDVTYNVIQVLVRWLGGGRFAVLGFCSARLQSERVGQVHEVKKALADEAVRRPHTCWRA